jgi:hypothetical protein
MRILYGYSHSLMGLPRNKSDYHMEMVAISVKPAETTEKLAIPIQAMLPPRVLT